MLQKFQLEARNIGLEVKTTNSKFNTNKHIDVNRQQMKKMKLVSGL